MREDGVTLRGSQMEATLVNHHQLTSWLLAVQLSSSLTLALSSTHLRLSDF